jgi:hypothetical protein
MLSARTATACAISFRIGSCEIWRYRRGGVAAGHQLVAGMGKRGSAAPVTAAEATVATPEAPAEAPMTPAEPAVTIAEAPVTPAEPATTRPAAATATSARPAAALTARPTTALTTARPTAALTTARPAAALTAREAAAPSTTAVSQTRWRPLHRRTEDRRHDRDKNGWCHRSRSW